MPNLEPDWFCGQMPVLRECDRHRLMAVTPSQSTKMLTLSTFSVELAASLSFNEI
ncbi:hypothetical protein H6G96_32205 [Nostoc sp. FACHB-892]|uniref:hypothetical protein n=1 Tax=Nostoc sp. FACHB-892 TaxID=2692843 RepID=UPI0016877CA8|nr:hypothetical protein [Nostoc sp. FACHB-892]MBD2730856.1 hypothetical protein [Nostoc sp. FACHB-892]